MHAPCEVAVKSVLPAIRAYVAKELTQTHKMKQTEVAQILGITQTAVSKYVTNERGQAIQIDQDRRVRGMMDEIALMITEEKTEATQLASSLCNICKVVREERLMCELCKRVDSTVDIKSCTLCTNGQACTSEV